MPLPPVLKKVDSTWASLAIIITIVAGSIVGWNYTMAAAEDVAVKATQATVNKAMIDGASQAAAEAVKQQLPAIAREVAKEVVKAQKEQDAVEKAEKEKAEKAKKVKTP